MDGSRRPCPEVAFPPGASSTSTATSAAAPAAASTAKPTVGLPRGSSAAGAVSSVEGRLSTSRCIATPPLPPLPSIAFPASAASLPVEAREGVGKGSRRVDCSSKCLLSRESDEAVLTVSRTSSRETAPRSVLTDDRRRTMCRVASRITCARKTINGIDGRAEAGTCWTKGERARRYQFTDKAVRPRTVGCSLSIPCRVK